MEDKNLGKEGLMKQENGEKFKEVPLISSGHQEGVDKQYKHRRTKAKLQPLTPLGKPSRKNKGNISAFYQQGGTPPPPI